MLDHYPSNFDIPEVRYREEEPWLPLSNVMQNWDIKFHDLMLNDRIRMMNYKKAIDETISLLHEGSKDRKVVRVMDIGTGTGILSAWVAQRWKELCNQNNTRCQLVLYPVEFNPNLATVADGRLRAIKRPLDIITPVIRKSSYDLDLSDLKVAENKDNANAKKINSDVTYNCIDLIVSELLGNLGDNEDMVAILSHAKARFLKKDPNGIMIPSRVEQYFIPVSSKKLYDKVRRKKMRTLSKNYKELLNEKTTNKYCDAVIPEKNHLSNHPKDPLMLWDFNKERTLNLEYNGDTEFTISRADTFHGFKGYFKAFLTDTVVLDLSPNAEYYIPDSKLRKVSDFDYSRRNISDCWKHGFLRIDKPIKVNQGDKIIFSYGRRLSPDFLSFNYRWEGIVYHNGGESFTEFGRSNTTILDISFDRPHVHHATGPKLDDDILQLELISHEYPLKGSFLMDEEIVVNQIMSFFNPSKENLKLKYKSKESVEELKQMSDARLGHEGICIGFPLTSQELKPEKFTWVNFSGKLVNDKFVPNPEDWIIYYRLQGTPHEEVPPSSFMEVEIRRYDDKAVKKMLEFLGTKDDSTYFLTMLVIPSYIFPNFSPSEILDLKTAYLMLEERIILEILKKDIIKHGTRSAVSAIMGRNMSHNIGSHVLANISKAKIGRDSKKLFKFLQHRMDFVAQISTTTPAGAIDIKLNDIVDKFNQQKYLKKYIADFRRLTAKDIIIKIPRPEDASKEMAIPTGEIGCHAMFSILENIIRNSARYGMQDEIDNRLRLSISVDDGNWRFYKVTIRDNCKNGLKAGELNDMFKEHIIDDKGILQRKALGLKEVKIMDSYLRLISQEEVDEKYDAYIVNPDDSDEPPIIKSVSDKDGNLEYVFFLLKPKKILIVSDRSWEHKAEFKAKGIDIINANTFENLNRKSIIHKFLLIDMNGISSNWFQKNILKHINSLPFRILIVDNITPYTLPKNIVFLSSLPEMNEPSNFYNKIWEEWVRGFYHSSHKLVLRTDAPITDYLPRFFSCINEDVDEIKEPEKAVLLDHREDSDLTLLYKNVACHIPFGSEESLFKVLEQIPDSQFLMYEVLEMGITRIAIIDDRIWRAKDSDISTPQYSAKPSRKLLNLWKKKGVDIQNTESLVEDFAAFVNLFPDNNYDFLVIHQGEIDEIIKRIGEDKFKELWAALRAKVVSAVIDTGRGSPAQATLDNLRWMPYSLLQECVSEKANDGLAKQKLLDYLMSSRAEEMR